MQFRHAAAATLAVLVVLAATPAPAAADEGGLAEIDAGDALTAVQAIANVAQAEADALRESAAVTIGSLAGDSPTAEDQADRMVKTINDHDDQWVQHLNDGLDAYNASAPNETWVLKLEIVDRSGADDGDASVVVLIDGDGENVTDVTAGHTTNVEPDATRTVSAQQASILAGDLAEYRQDYVATGTVPGPETLVYYASKYDIREVQR